MSAEAIKAAPAERTPAAGVGRAWLGAVLQPLQARIGLGLLALCLVTAVAGVIWSPDPNTVSADVRLPPTGAHPFGTDALGRDVFERTLAGGVRLMTFSALAAAVSVVIGATVGALLAYRGGLADMALMRGVDVLISFPLLIMALLAAALLPPSYLGLTLVAIGVSTPPTVRVCRGLFGEVLCRDFVTVAALRGESAPALIGREAVPNVIGPLLVEFAIRWNLAVLLLATLNFLGVGVQPPAADWGLALFEARSELLVAPWAAIAPAIGIAALAIGINFTGDAISESIARKGRTEGGRP